MPVTVDFLSQHLRRQLAFTCAIVFGLQAAVAVLMLSILVPPFENSDEFNHFDRVDQISRGGLIATRFAGPMTSGGMADPGIGKVDQIIGSVRFHPEQKVDGSMLRRASVIGWTTANRVTFANTAIYAPMLYGPEVFGVWLGKLARLSIVHSLMLARAAGGLFDVALAMLAIAMAGECAPLLMIMLALPMSLSLFASVSQDGAMLAMAALSVGLLTRLRGLAGVDGAANSTLFWLCLCVALLTIGRPAYAPLVILPLLLPQFSIRIRGLATGAIVFALGFWSICVASFTMINGSLDRGVMPSVQLHALLRHPERILSLAVKTFAGRQGMEGQSYFHELIGVLGWIDVVLPNWFYRLAGWTLCVAVISTICRRSTLLSKPASGWLFVAAISACGLIFLLEYLTWSPVEFPFVDGVQGRYFLPIALFLPAFLPSLRLPEFEVPTTLLRAALLLFPALSIAVTIAAVVHRYYV